MSGIQTKIKSDGCGFDGCVGCNSELHTNVKKSPFKFPTERYLNVVKKGYRDCKLDNRFLIKALKT